MDITRNKLAGFPEEMVGAEPTGGYARGRMYHDYADAGLSGASSVGAGALSAIMANDPSLLWRYLGSPAMGLFALGSGLEALKYKSSGDAYRRYAKDQPD